MPMRTKRALWRPTRRVTCRGTSFSDWRLSLQAVIAAMVAHPFIAAIQQRGCDALKNLVLQQPEAQESVAQHGGVDAIVVRAFFCPNRKLTNILC